jgi:ribonuclease T1
MERRTLTRGGLAAVLVLCAVYLLLGGDLPNSGSGDGGHPPGTTIQTQSDQPSAAGGSISQQETQEITRVLALVAAGGPFAHEQDGSTFENREGQLPQEPPGYYKEYTCETPGSQDRGARRLVIGQGGETYYTADHYESFTEIDPDDYR